MATNHRHFLHFARMGEEALVASFSVDPARSRVAESSVCNCTFWASKESTEALLSESSEASSSSSTKDAWRVVASTVRVDGVL
jgi:hypothetical protein